MHDFPKDTSQEVLEALKMARMEIIRLQVKEVAKSGQAPIARTA
jgi:antitoxin component of RelBE/YafQ-DinJ toxin-antitoxin module